MAVEYKRAFALIGAYVHPDVPARSVLALPFSIDEVVPFSGMFFVTSENGRGAGALIEDQGASTVAGRLHFERGTFSFVKEYVRREGQVCYDFERQGDLWVGTFSVPRIRPGKATLRVFEAGTGFLQKARELSDAVDLTRSL